MTVSRSEFVYEGQQKLSGSTAIHAADGSKTALTISEVTVIGYSSAVSVDSGNVSVSDSEFGSNITAITSLKGAVSVSDTEFVSNSMALRIGVSDTTPVLSGCVFRSNETAIETFVPLRNDYAAQNKFIGNTVTVSEKF